MIMLTSNLVILDSVGMIIHLLCYLFACNSFDSPRVWTLRQVAATNDLLVPLLQIPDQSPTARRIQCWLFACLVHSFTVTIHTSKGFMLAEDRDHWKLLVMCSGPLVVFLVSFVLLVILLKHYPIKEVQITT